MQLYHNQIINRLSMHCIFPHSLAVKKKTASKKENPKAGSSMELQKEQKQPRRAFAKSQVKEII